jgi:hypothetical protein
MSRCLIPINIEHHQYFYLILNMDFDQYDFDKIIMEKNIPLIRQEKRNSNMKIKFCFLLYLMSLQTTL